MLRHAFSGVSGSRSVCGPHAGWFLNSVFVFSVSSIASSPCLVDVRAIPNSAKGLRLCCYDGLGPMQSFVLLLQGGSCGCAWARIHFHPVLAKRRHARSGFVCVCFQSPDANFEGGLLRALDFVTPRQLDFQIRSSNFTRRGRGFY